MSQIYFLGREDRDGLALRSTGRIGRLTFDEEVGGWDNMNTEGHQPEFARRGIQLDVSEDAFGKVFTLTSGNVFTLTSGNDSLAQHIASQRTLPGRPTVCYQTRFGNDQ